MNNSDRFWSVDKLIPGSGRGTAPSRSGGWSLSMLDDGSVPEGGEPALLRTFGDSAVLKSAAVYRAADPGGSYSGFAAAARRAVAATPSGDGSYHRYFSYAPDFSELTPAQLDSYLRFREDVKARRVRPVDYSYFLLLVYSGVNLATPSNAGAFLDALIWLWESYREDFAVIDRLFCDWVLDLCLQFGLPLPLDKLDGVIPKIPVRQTTPLCNAYLFDRALAPGRVPDAAQRDMILNMLCDYRFRSLAYYRERPAYASAMETFIERLFDRGFLTVPDQRAEFLQLPIPTGIRIKRRLYPSAALDPSLRMRVELEMIPLIGDVNVRDRFTSLIKYIDNRVRRGLGLKPKFSAVSISPVHRDFIDAVYESDMSSAVKRVERGIAAAPVRKLEVDAGLAGRIESESWDSTRILTEGIEIQGETVTLGEIPRKAPETPEVFANPDPEGGVTEFCASLDEVLLGFLVKLLYGGPAPAREYALAQGQFFEGMVGKINRAASEFVGDVVLRHDGKVLPDYREELEFLLPEDQYPG